MATNDNDKKILDVSKPGKTPPASTSRPIIVTNRPMVKDDTVTSSDKTDDESKTSQKPDDKPLVKSESKVIAPLNPDASEDKPTEDKSKKAESTSKSDAQTTEKSTDTPAEESEKSEVGNETTATEQIPGGRAEQQKQAEMSEAEKAQKDKTDKLIAEGKYAVPIGHIKRNRRARKVLTILLLVVLLGIVAADLLVDAGIIQTNIKPPIDLIKN